MAQYVDDPSQPNNPNSLGNLLQNNNVSPEATAAVNTLVASQGEVDVGVGSYDPATGAVNFSGAGGGTNADVVLFDFSTAPANSSEIEVSAPTGYSEGQVYAINIPAGVKVKIVFNTVERMIDGGDGDEFIMVEGDRNTTVDGGAGDDRIDTSGGNDSIDGGLGNDTIIAGAGDDTVVASQGEDWVNTGTGDDVITFDFNQGDATISVQDLQDGALVVENGGNVTHIFNAEELQFADGGVVIIADEYGDQIPNFDEWWV